MATGGRIGRIIGLGVLLGCSYPAMGQLTAGALEDLRQEGKARGWTFNVAPNPATLQRLDQLCGFVPPANRLLRATSEQPVQEHPIVGLPTSFDWRTLSGCPPVRNQGGCGSCWAFGTLGAVECAILIRDQYLVDLSEQWLVSCNTYNYSCDGGWWAYDFLIDTPDECSKIGALLESDFPYTATDAACVCAARTYRLSSWAEVNPSVSIPSVDAIKQAIMTYGPVAVAVRVDSAFTAYHDGVFNASAVGAVNHAVVLVGWDDSQGAAGVWFLRNSWGSGWGESGYMRIAYGCSSVGYGATYVNYPGAGIVTSVDQTTVAENGTTTLQVHLMAPPTSNVTASISRVSGDSDISVTGGASLTFTPANWKVDQSVTLAAGDDSDNQNGQATIRCSAAGLQSRDVTVTEVDDDPLVILTDLSAVSVAENGSANLRIKLSSAITVDTLVSCTRISGDSDLAVTVGATRTFTAADWGTYQTITFVAANDADAINSSAIFRLSASGLPSLDIVVTESDDDVISIVPSATSVNVAEGSVAGFQIRLSASPGPAGLVVSVARASGDTDIDVQSGAALTFTSSNWNTDQTVTVRAAADGDTVNGQAVIRCTAPGSPEVDVTVTEQDSTVASLEVDRSVLMVLEGRTASFGVRLGWQPTSAVSVVVSNPLGDADLVLASTGMLVFTAANWNVYQTVTVAAAPDDDAANGQAVVQCISIGLPVQEVTVLEQDDDTLCIVVEASSLEVSEGTSAPLRIRLGAAPDGIVEVAVGRVSGDADLEVASGSVLTFDALNWNIAQTTTIAAVPDVDVIGGQAVFRCSAAGLPAIDVTVSERDADVLTIQLNRPAVTIPEGETATFSVRLSHQPTENVLVYVSRDAGDGDIEVVSGSTLVFTPSNWTVYQEVVLSAGDDTDMSDGTAVITCVAPGLTGATIVATEQDLEVSPEPGTSPPWTSSGSSGLGSPSCGAGAGMAVLACCATGLLPRRRRRNNF